MRSSPASWVPSGAWLAPGYAEWQAPAALRGPVACLWTRVVPADGAGQELVKGLVLPDACSDLIWEQGVGAYVAGPDTGPVATETRPGAVLVGVRFRPAAGGQVLRLPLSELRDQRVPLASLRPRAALGLPASLAPAVAAAVLLDLTRTLIADGTPDPAISEAASLLRDPAARAEDVAARIGLSERQLRRRSHAAAGYGPKTLQRVLRFQRFVRLLDAGGPVDLAGAAARFGYADQAHLTRDCGALSGLSPTALAQARRRSSPPEAQASPAAGAVERETEARGSALPTSDESPAPGAPARYSGSAVLSQKQMCGCNLWLRGHSPYMGGPARSAASAARSSQAANPRASSESTSSVALTPPPSMLAQNPAGTLTVSVTAPLTVLPISNAAARTIAPPPDRTPPFSSHTVAGSTASNPMPVPGWRRQTDRPPRAWPEGRQTYL